MGQIPMEKFLDLYALKHTETKPEPAPTKSQHRSFHKWEKFTGRKGQTNSKWFFQADVSSKNRTTKFDFFLEEIEDTI